MPTGGTYQLAGVLCPARTDPSSPATTLGFTSSHLEHLLFWQIRPGLLQKTKCRTLGLYWTQMWVWSLQKMHKGNSGSPSRELQER